MLEYCSRLVRRPDCDWESLHVEDPLLGFLARGLQAPRPAAGAHGGADGTAIIVPMKLYSRPYTSKQSLRSTLFDAYIRFFSNQTDSKREWEEIGRYVLVSRCALTRLQSQPWDGINRHFSPESTSFFSLLSSTTDYGVCYTVTVQCVLPWTFSAPLVVTLLLSATDQMVLVKGYRSIANKMGASLWGKGRKKERTNPLS